MVTRKLHVEIFCCVTVLCIELQTKTVCFFFFAAVIIFVNPIVRIVGEWKFNMI
jgi:hypothetical protein